MKKLLFVLCLCLGGVLMASAQTAAPAKAETKACCKKDAAKANASCHSATASTDSTKTAATKNCCAGKTTAHCAAPAKSGTASASSAPADKKCEKGDACCQKKTTTTK